LFCCYRFNELKQKLEANYAHIRWKHWEALVCVLEKLVHEDGVKNMAFSELANPRDEIEVNNSDHRAWLDLLWQGIVVF
jgi:hypothetical protein